MNCSFSMSVNDEESVTLASTLPMPKLLFNHRKGCLSLSFPVMVEEMMLSMTDVFVSDLRFEELPAIRGLLHLPSSKS